MSDTGKKWLWAGLYIAAPLLLIFAIWMGNPRRLSSVSAILPLALGAAAYAMMCAQVVMASRLPALEHAFGLDRILRFHGMAAMAAIVLAAGHKVLIHGGFRFRPAHWGDLSLLLYVVLGILAMVFLTGLLARHGGALRKTLYRFRLTRYDSELLLHHGMVLALFFMFLHVAAKPFMRNAFTGTLLFLYTAFALGCYGWHLFFRKKAAFTVEKVLPEGDMTTIVMKGEKPFAFRPGQFGFLRLADPAVSEEWHPFSFSSSPKEETLSMTIKSAGDWTDKVKQVKAGSAAFIDGPYGRFSPFFYGEEEPLVLIAGGVGITPMMSIVSYYRKAAPEKQILLLWCARKREDLIRKSGWEVWEKDMAHFHLVPILSRDPSWPGRKGRITEEVLKEALGESHIDKDRARYYFCGPAPLEETVLSILQSLAVPKDRLVREKFSL